MQKYNRYSLALTNEEDDKLKAVKESSGFGVKKIFMAMVEALLPPPIETEEEI